jgi:hypothetical protein
MWIDWSVAAAAPADCEELDATTFRAFVFDAQSAIDRGDVELTTTIVDSVWVRLPCLDFSPEPTLWADLLVSSSIVEYSRGGDWKAPLSAALRIRKGIDRGVGPGHPIYSFEPPPEPPMGPPVPLNARLLIDGRSSPVLPPDEGLWLVQKTDGRFWNTLLLRDEALPEEWVAAPVVGPPRIVAWTRVGGTFGVGASESAPDWRTTRFPAGDAGTGTGFALGGAADVHATFFSPFGVQATARASWFPGSPGLEGRLLGIVERGALTIGGGVGAGTVDVFERVPVSGDVDDLEIVTASPLVRSVVGSVMLHPSHRPLSDGGRPFDLGVTAGGSRAGALVDLEAGAAGNLGGDQVFRLGVVAAWRTGVLSYSGLPGGRVDATTFRLLLRFDFVFGEY